jgi:diguanylate cyclase (GGDEF)-like protein
VTIRESTAVTQSEWSESRKKTKRVAHVSGLLAVVLIAALGFPVAYLVAQTSSGDARYLATAGWLALLVVPVSVIMVIRSVKAQNKSDAVIENLARQLTEAVEIADTEAAQQVLLAQQLTEAVEIADREAAQRGIQARRQQFESRLANALDMAEGEPEVIDVIERSFASTIPEAPVELLLADNSHAHLLRMATASPTGNPPGCGVDSPDHCPAARRAQVQRFSDSEELDACPKLRGRLDGTMSALCVPVSIMGRTVGIIHATGAQHGAFAEDTVQDLETLAKLAGARIGLLRVMAETQLQAATDNLTGLLNRRSFDEQASALRRREPRMAVAMSDLDHFKALNDTYGHETGDRALRLFADVLSKSVRAQDLVCRHGGEEFVIALPACAGEEVRGILDALRVRLEAALIVAGLPRFTVSFGVVEATHQEDLPTIIARADAALFQAKRDGRDQVIVHDSSGGATSAPEGAEGVSTSSGEELLLQREQSRVNDQLKVLITGGAWPGGCEVGVGTALDDCPVLVEDGDVQAGDAAVRAGPRPANLGDGPPRGDGVAWVDGGNQGALEL